MLDDPRYDVCAEELSLARDLPVDINGTELRALSEEVEGVLVNLFEALGDENFGGDFVAVTSGLLAVQAFLRKLEEKFDAAGGRGAP